jgi:hypothetical protein
MDRTASIFEYINLRLLVPKCHDMNSYRRAVQVQLHAFLALAVRVRKSFRFGCFTPGVKGPGRPYKRSCGPQNRCGHCGCIEENESLYLSRTEPQTSGRRQSFH